MAAWQRIAQDERGATMILVAGSLLVLMGFAALAVDWGSGVIQLREDQNAVDFGAMAAVLDADLTPPAPGAPCDGFTDETLAACNGTEEALRIAEANLGVTPDWTQLPCDTNRPAEFTIVSPLTDCVSFTDDLSMARVISPTITADVYFSQVFGYTGLNTVADAEAGAVFGLSGKVLPFGIPGNAAAQDHECLRTGSQPDWEPCDGPTTGNFGSLDVAVYGPPIEDTIEQCGNADTNGRFTWNIAKGIDHPWRIYNAADGVINDRTACPVYLARANQVIGQTGLGSGLDFGLLYETDDYSASGTTIPGRLVRGGNTILVRSAGGAPWAAPANVDNTPLYSFLLRPAPLFRDACWNLDIDLNSNGDYSDPGDVLIIGNVTDHAEMEDCLEAWRLMYIPQDVIFDASIGDAVRYGFAPELAQANFSSGTANYEIAGFLPLYIETTWFGCTGANECDTVHTPGETDMGSCAGITEPGSIHCGTPGSYKALDAVSSFFLRKGMLPASIQTPFPGDDSQITINLTR